MMVPLYSKKFSLAWELSDILGRTSAVGYKASSQLLKDIDLVSAKAYQQDHSKATIYPRRKPEDSLLRPEMLKNMTARQVHDFIRALQPPYPQAHILDKDGRRFICENLTICTSLI